MSPALTLIAASIAAALGFTSAWQIQAHTITKIHLEQADERIAIQRAARQTAERLTSQVATAQANTAKREVVLRRAAGDTVFIGNGLRLKTADAVRTAASDPALCSDAARTLGELFDDSAKAYAELAEISDRHVIDIQALIERQPR